MTYSCSSLEDIGARDDRRSIEPELLDVDWVATKVDSAQTGG